MEKVAIDIIFLTPEGVLQYGSTSDVPKYHGMTRTQLPSLEALVVAPPSPDQARLTDLVYATLQDQGGAVGHCESISDALDALKTLARCGFIFLAESYGDAAITDFSLQARRTIAGKEAVFIQALNAQAHDTAARKHGNDTFQIDDLKFAPCKVNQLN